ncbi:hypothetical protein JTE90_004527 [Oedothorax gibbosus]|uniref:DNA mismatch repair protein Mlh3 n=1 Tax=Oedothorax gibbosus TaxID=931172 RepID=A0AAV6VF21_9ARAC|nr:hypothetical protein JTE90_004527 [Oedothorax gibbosus]
MQIQSLDPDVVKKLRSDLAFSSVAQCVEELVWNSIDSGANCIAVRINLPSYKIQVIDNGCGIPSDQLSLVGNRYSTSKCHTLDDLQNLQYVGFRGEALASLSEVSSNLMIESRASDSPQTYCKIFTHGKASEPSISINSRPSKGTTVTVFDFMYNRPVRRLGISEGIDVEDTRRLLQSIALVQPHISFSLQNESTGEMCLQFRKCSSTFHAFVELFGKEKGRSLKSVEAKFEGYEVSGCIGKEPFATRDFQFLYVNKRLLYKTKLHKLINDWLNKSFIKKHMDNLTSPSKNQQQYCAFVLDIACSKNKYDAVFEHKRTIVEFTEWEKVPKLMELVVLDFLRSQNLMSGLADLEEPTISSLNDIETSNVLNLGVDYFKNGLFSHAAKRREDKKEETLNNHTPVLDAFEKMHQTLNFSNVQINLNSNPGFELTDLCNEISNTRNIAMGEISDRTCAVSSRHSTNQNYVCLKNTCHASVFDTLKGNNVTKKTRASSIDKQVAIPVSVESQVDIPSRSVFPIQSPVMLRVPPKSTLSQLKREKNRPTMTLQMKEKFTFSSNKARKFTESVQEITLKVKNKPDLVKDKYEANLKPLPAALKHSCKNVKEITTISDTSSIEKNRVSKSVSLLDKDANRIASKYKFSEDPNLSPLKRLRFSKKQKKTTIPVENNSDCISTDSEHSETFKLDPILEIPESNSSSSVVFGTFDTNRITDLNSLVNYKESFRTTPFVPNNGKTELSHKKFHSNQSKCVLHSKSHLFEDKTSHFFLESFTSNKRKSREDIIPKHTKNFKGFSAFNLDHFQDLVEDSIQIDCDDSSKICDSLLTKIQTSTDLITPDSHLNAINVKATATVGSKQPVISKANQSFQQSLQNKCVTDQTPNNVQSVSGIIKKSNGSSTNLFEDSNELNSTLLAQMMIQNLDKDIKLPGINENYTVPDLNCPKYKINPLPHDSPDILIPSSEMPSFVALETKNCIATCNKPSSTFERHFNSDSSIDDNKSVKPSSNNFNMGPKKNLPVFDISAMESLTKTYSPSESLDLSLPTESVPVQEKINCSSGSCIEIPSDSIYSIDETEAKKSNMALADSSPSSVALNTVLEIINENGDFEIPMALQEMKSVSNNGIKTKNVDLHQHNLSTITEELSCDNTTIESSADVYKCTSVSETANNNASLCLENNKEANCANKSNTQFESNCSKEKQLHDEKSDSLEHNLSNTSDNITANKCDAENSNGEVMDVDSQKFEDNQNEIMENRWISHLNEGTKRIAYIDSVTGNSTYILPETLNKSASSKEDLVEAHKKKSHFFLTHDFSPFVQSSLSQKEPTDIYKECELQSKLHRHIDNEEVNELEKKWRNPSEKSISSYDNVQNIFRNWENPMFDIASEMNSIEDPKIPVCLPHMYFLNSYRFNSNSLSSSKVIGQVDCKFIACIIQDFSDNHKNQRLLTLLDQHAVHERIRLEELTDDLYEAKEDGKHIVKSQPITTPLTLTLDPSEIRLLFNYHSRLQDLGIFLNLDDEARVISLPACFVKDGGQLRRKADDTCVLLEKIIKEWLSSLMQHRGVSSLLPKTLGAVLNSQACRGAVKFGDPLNLTQCQDLVADLAHCNLPFQCAHGRPSIAPILDLNKLATLSKKRKLPQLWKLRAQPKRQC